jgi:hypothetical protein
MTDQEKKRPAQEAAAPPPAPEIQNEDFQFVLKALLAAYQPILEQQLNLAKNPEELKKQAQSRPPNCADEIAEANRIFAKFFTEEVALRMIPPEGRKQLGPIDSWRWCLAHLRCCFIFGWLVCRGPRTFRAWAYYVYQYWRCIRESLGRPVSDPPTEEQRQDFRTLVSALAVAYKPYLTDQLASVEFPAGIPDEVLSGQIDCFESQDDVCAIFERFLTGDAAQALLGREAFAAHSKDPNFWFCRCWCLCAICFGCCLARARSFIGVLWCLVYFFRCLRDCSRPIICEITNPHDCVEEEEFPVVGILRGVEIRGSAGGAFCDHYTLQWRQGGLWQSIGIVYPGGAAQGHCGVINGTLGYLQTLPLVSPGPAITEIQLCVYSTQGGAPHCCPGQFILQRNAVWIRGLEYVNAPDIFDPTSQIVNGAGVVQSFGNESLINGSAVIGGCQGQDIKRYTLAYYPDFVADPNLPGFVQFWQVDYITPLQIDDGLNRVFENALTSFWTETNFPFFLHPCNPVFDSLQPTWWPHLFPESLPQQFPPAPPQPAPCLPPPSWTTTPLPLSVPNPVPPHLPLANCQSGKFTLRLKVEGQGGAIKTSLRQVWFDNKQIKFSHCHITQIAGIDPCATVDLRKFVPLGGDCTVPWKANLLGVAYDEYIFPVDASVPSDNFGGYSLWIKKDGAPDPGYPIPIPGPGGPPWPGPFVGTGRIGDPGGDVCPYTALIPPPGDGILAILDMRRLDWDCNKAEPDLTLKRGECCGFIITLKVWDNTICPGLAGGHHENYHHFPVCICNHADIPQ